MNFRPDLGAMVECDTLLMLGADFPYTHATLGTTLWSK